MQVTTRHFGKIEIDEKSIINFPCGIPGFENIKNFTILSGDDENSPFRWLQGVDDPSIAFAIVNPFTFIASYEFDLNQEQISQLEIEKMENVAVFSIVVVPDDITKVSMNLKAPVIINTDKMKGMQVVLDTNEYSVRHYILDKLHEREVTENACSDAEKGAIHCNK